MRLSPVFSREFPDVSARLPTSRARNLHAFFISLELSWIRKGNKVNTPSKDKKMTIACYSLKRVAAGMLLSLALIACTLQVGAAAQSSPMLNKKELKLLLASAKTSADKQKLVSYYRAKAERLT